MKVFRRTVFVVGAGASREFLLPTGRELLDEISKSVRWVQNDRVGSFRFDPTDLRYDFERTQLPAEALERGGSIVALMHEAKWIARTCKLAPSIDNLLHAHSHNPLRTLAGKMLIANAIVMAEDNSSLCFRDQQAPGQFLFNEYKPDGAHGPTYEPTKSWLGELFWILVENHTFEEFKTFLSSTVFISFNYDRCIRHFLVNAASVYFDLSHEDVADVNRALKVIHPYGSLGDLVVQGKEIRGFGSIGQDLHEVAARIKTFTEGVAVESDTGEILGAFHHAEIVCFLGFGYLDLNMERLFPKPEFGIRHIIGTAYQVSRQAKGTIREFLARNVRYGASVEETRNRILAGVDFSDDNHVPEISLQDMTCRELLQRNRNLFRPARRI